MSALSSSFNQEPISHLTGLITLLVNLLVILSLKTPYRHNKRLEGVTKSETETNDARKPKNVWPNVGRNVVSSKGKSKKGMKRRIGNVIVRNVGSKRTDDDVSVTSTSIARSLLISIVNDAMAVFNALRTIRASKITPETYITSFTCQSL
ncbi:hypothetical protein C8R42DRAFT_771639 [Lentinula raphanica]|nr:hypothetical protein C8R42DRAFT_771639 [Lentinula raphanica]